MQQSLVKDGFVGQRMVYIPGHTKRKVLLDSRTQDLYITHIGHFPKAHGHFRNRPLGCAQFIFIYCQSGEGWIKMDNKKHILREHQLFIIPPHTSCSYGSDSVNPWNNYWIHYTGANAEAYSPTCGLPITISQTVYARTEERLSLFEEMLQNLENFNNFDNVVYANITLKYFLTTIKQINNYRIQEKKLSTDKLTIATTYMKNQLKNRITLGELSLVCQCSESNLYKLFVKNLHCSPVEYFLQMKLQKACRLLAHSSLKVKEIAQELGYDDAYYFSRLFSKQIGKSPIKYREEEQGK